MKLKLEFDIPEEQQESQEYFYAPVAWAAIDESMRIIRAHDKHGVGTPDKVLQQVWVLLNEARSKTE